MGGMKTDGFRKAQIERQFFYFEQSRKRLLSQFADLGKEADQSAVAWLEENSHRFDPDRDDPGSFEEAAYFHGVDRYYLLTKILDAARLSVVAGMYHEWDKQHRTWILEEVRDWHKSPELGQSPTSTNTAEEHRSTI